jgi:uncharacterized NAD(P)/FAD-binding protein YdhS
MSDWLRNELRKARNKVEILDNDVYYYRHTHGYFLANKVSELLKEGDVQKAQDAIESYLVDDEKLFKQWQSSHVALKRIQRAKYQAFKETLK